MQTLMQSPTVATLFSSYASLTGSIVLIRTMANEFIPRPVRAYLVSAITSLFKQKITINNNRLTLVIEPQVGMVRNEVYDAAEFYLGTIIGPNVDRLKVGKIANQKTLSVSIEKNQELSDTFRGIKLSWKVVFVTEKQNTVVSNNSGREKTYLELSFEKNFKDTVLNEYLPHIVDEVKRMKEGNRAVKLFTKSLPNSGRGNWGSITLDHPATFDTIAMNSELKKAIIEDLNKFLRRRDFYRRVGKAWKRGYLLYGPPGTGKSSLIAAIANYLKFDVYDLELTSLYSDSELRRILLSTSNRSIIVIEDIDCSVTLQRRSNPRVRRVVQQGQVSSSENEETAGKSQLSLSGMLNFADGLWSCCGDERIIIFTTNHKDKIDPALLRPGRMDMHIHMTYCTSESFKILASRYLGEHDNQVLFGEIDDFIESVEVTPAEVAEELLRNEDPDFALNCVVNLLKRKKAEADEAGEDEKHFMSQENSRDINGDASSPDGVKRQKTVPSPGWSSPNNS